MKTLKNILEKSHDYLAEKKISSPRRQAELLVADVLGLTRIELYMDLERPLNRRGNRTGAAPRYNGEEKGSRCNTFEALWISWDAPWALIEMC